MLGGFTFRRGDWVVDEAAWRRPIATRLVRFLLSRHDDAVSEDVKALWPGKPSVAARRSLQVAVSEARSVLDLPGAERSALEAGDRAYLLVLGPRDSLDAHFEALAKAGLAASGDARRRTLERAVFAWTGEPLPEDRYASWAQPWRGRLTARYEEVLTALATACRDAADHFGAIDASSRLVTVDPLNEEAHRDVMVANARAGRVAHALRQYLSCRSLLVDTLGIEPSPETKRLHARILAREPV